MPHPHFFSTLYKMEQETNCAMRAMFNAIEHDDYATMLTLLKQPEFDINQWSTEGRYADQTAIAFAIQMQKPELVQLFLTMGANPHGGHAFTNPINLINFADGDPEKNEAMKELFLTHQHPTEQRYPSIVSDYELNFTEKFIAAIRAGDHRAVEAILLDIDRNSDENEDEDGVFIYTDQCCYDIMWPAFALAVESGCDKTVALLLKRGAAISNPHVRAWLEDNEDHPNHRAINTLIQREKQKQVDIMCAFSAHQGDWMACKNIIFDIQKTFNQNKPETFAQIMENLLHEAERKKRSLVYQTASSARVTRFFENNTPHALKSTVMVKRYGVEALNNPNQPTLFTPWGKALCPQGMETSEHYDTAKTTFSGALLSTCIQLCVDVLGTLANTLMIIPNLVYALYYATLSLRVNDEIQQVELVQRAKEYLAAPILAPYFALAIVVDLLRESLALFTRTYATFVQTPEERACPTFSMG